jgi:hypothetical protein
MTRRLSLGAAVGLALLGACQSEAPRAAVPPSEATAELLPVTIRTAGGTRKFSVEVARTDAEQARRRVAGCCSPSPRPARPASG